MSMLYIVFELVGQTFFYGESLKLTTGQSDNCNRTGVYSVLITLSTRMLL